MKPYQRWAGVCRWLVWGSYLGLLLAQVLATLVIPSGGREPNVTIWLLVSAPLLVLLPGVWRGGVKAHAWLSFVSLIYFTFAVNNLAVPRRSLLDGVELLLSIVLFSASMLYVRWHSRALRSAAADAETSHG